jgi:succinoglycan biosynthesis protein ExoA
LQWNRFDPKRSVCLELTGTAPTITVVVPMRNESDAIEACLESVLASSLAQGHSIEVLVLDGRSTDDSAARVTAISRRDPRVQLVDNPERLQAAAFNRGIAMARGGFVVRLDAHSTYPADYIAESVRLLQETGAGNVGGIQSAEGSGWVGRAIAAAVSSRFAAGDAQYRFATKPQFTDTVYLGAWRTETVRALGGMRTDLAVNEDYEMNVRLRAAGGTVYLSPTIRSTYRVRSSLGRLSRQYWRYGFWKARTLLEHPHSLRWRQTVAPAFVLALLLTPLWVHWLGVLGLAHVGLYLAATTLASWLVARNRGRDLVPILPLVFAIVHCSWGAGVLCGLIWWPLRRK